MPNNNPDGYNAFGGPNERETPYGAVEKLKTLTRSAPHGSAPALEAPRRAQRRAIKGPAQPQAQGGPVMPPAPERPTMPYKQMLQQFWTSLASEPGASDAVKALAAEVQGG